jgi:hypothetical protein
MERLVNAVIQASKKITDTEISSGATGFFAAVRYIINNVQDIGTKTFSCLVLENW